MSVSAARVTLGSVPRRASLAPSSRITASVPSGTDQSSRSRPPELVSPETPALIISTSIPLIFKDCFSRAGNAAEAERPSPALSESPNTTILIGLPAPSGSGKSTLLMVMAGLERPDSGEVVVNGTPFNALDEDALARFRGRQVGIVFQSFHLIPTMTALENVAVPLELAGNPEAAQRAAQELTSVGLGDRLHHYPTQLSGGEQQRVALARALAPDPAILVADEPTGNLDEATGKQIVDLLFTK